SRGIDVAGQRRANRSARLGAGCEIVHAGDRRMNSSTADWATVRADFPLLAREVNGKPLIYLDSANTSQKPRSVIDAVDDFYRAHNANVSRAVHTLGSEATDAYEGARKKVASFLNIRADDLVLTSGTTQAINLVAYSFALPRLKPGA